MDNIEMRQGDCFNMLPAMEPNCVDAVIMDMPYGTTNLSWDKKIDLPMLWELIRYVLKTGGPIIAFSQQPFTTDLINSNRKWFRYEIIWKKTAPVGFLDANIRPMRLHENILVFCETYRRSNDGKRAAMTYNPQMTIGKPYSKKSGKHRSAHYYFEGVDRDVVNKETRFPVDVIEVPNRGGKAYHPTQKPVELMEWLVRTYSREGELVLDPFAGAGSTMLACASTGRRGIGMEREGKYVEIYKERVKELGIATM